MNNKKIKGNIAELIVQLMFEASGREIHKIAIEDMKPHLFERLTQLNYNFKVQELCQLPDFLLVHPNNNLEFVEVKYRQQGRFSPSEINAIRNSERNWGASTIVLSFNNQYRIERIRAIRPPYQFSFDGNLLNAVSPLNVPEWRIHQLVFNRCCCLVELIELHSNMNNVQNLIRGFCQVNP